MQNSFLLYCAFLMGKRKQRGEGGGRREEREERREEKRYREGSGRLPSDCTAGDERASLLKGT